ncbi:histidine phosphatase superfamily [Gymnopilus junonius]|uniref:Histidine phosphatase superfamily n=1 Tax=Gymnopilus junonius TaxID=109634 RepID=A0A9P5TML9_GYMJU|nr:histidine phosphatase superfamily [Gymnopilus junonius]
MRRGSKIPNFLLFFVAFFFFHIHSAECLDEPDTSFAGDGAHTPSDTETEIMHLDVLKGRTSENRANHPGYLYPQVPLDVENYPVGPEGLQLEQVHVYVRHGERTPVGVRMNDPPASISDHWMMCKTARRFQDSVSSLLGVPPEQIPRLKEGEPGSEDILLTTKIVERKDGTAVEGECLLGELTDLGRQSTYNFGRNLRKLYIDRLGFLPDTLSNKDSVYFRTTNMPRTIDSLLEIMHGIYPTHKCQPNAAPSYLVRNGKDENLIGNTYACKRLEILQIGFATAAAQAFNPSLEPLDKKLSKYLGGNPIRVDGKPRASGIMDTVRASLAHGVKVPPEFTDKSVVDVIEHAIVNEWFAGYKTEEVRRLGMGRLLDDIARKMQYKVEHGESDPLKILVHSTHDTALAALCSTFDAYDEQWPAFTASISFELFKKIPESQGGFSQAFLSRLGSPSPQHYIRMRYQNKNMILPMCAQEGDHLEGHPEFCTLSAFQARVKELTPTDWDAECLPAGKT